MVMCQGFHCCGLGFGVGQVGCGVRGSRLVIGGGGGGGGR